MMQTNCGVSVPIVAEYLILALLARSDQFEFTISSLVLMGKISADDVRPILEKFKKLTGDKEKLTSSDLSGPTKKKKMDEENVPEHEEPESLASEIPGGNAVQYRKTAPLDVSTKRSSILIGKQIAQAFREEIWAGAKCEEIIEEESLEDYSTFCVPKNTHGIAIDNSKIGRKQLGRILEFSGIPADRRIIVGDGYDEIMGFVDYCVNFIQNHSGYVFMIGA